MSTIMHRSESRGAARRRVLRSGRVAYGEGMSTDCPIRDESATGARISIGAHPLPRDLLLVCVSTGVAYEAHVVWRRGQDAGVRFGRRHLLERQAATPATSLRLAQRLWSHRRAG
jgi:hypothetical protein